MFFKIKPALIDTFFLVKTRGRPSNMDDLKVNKPFRRLNLYFTYSQHGLASRFFFHLTFLQFVHLTYFMDLFSYLNPRSDCGGSRLIQSNNLCQHLVPLVMCTHACVCVCPVSSHLNLLGKTYLCMSTQIHNVVIQSQTKPCINLCSLGNQSKAYLFSYIM